MIRALHIREQPECIPVLASWFHNEWGGYSPYHSLEHEKARLRFQLQTWPIPFTLVAVIGKTPVASASVLSFLADPQDCSDPWLSYVYVRPELRGRGIGKFIVRSAESKAIQLGLRKLSLVTLDRDGFFARLGWRIMHRAHDQVMTFMEKELINTPVTRVKCAARSLFIPPAIRLTSICRPPNRPASVLPNERAH